MMKLNRALIATYVSLESEKAVSYLVSLANRMTAEISESQSYEDIAPLLKVLREFAFRVPEQTVTIAGHLIRKPCETGYLEILGARVPGKTYEEVVGSVIELLEQIRYIHPDGVLPLLAELMRLPTPGIKSRAAEAVKKLARFDFNVLTKTKIGYGAQRKCMDFVLAWSQQERLDNIDFVLATTQQILSSSVEGTSTESVDTITMHFGAVKPTEFLKKLRREAIDLLAGIYRDASDEKVRLQIVSALEEAARPPLHTSYEDDVREMVADDAQYLVSVYRSMVFHQDGTLSDSLAVAGEIEARLCWFEKSGKGGPDASRLRQEMLDEPMYALFRLLAGTPASWRVADDWREAERKRSDALDEQVESVARPDVLDWKKKLDAVASQAEIVGDWQLNSFREFLQRLGSKKPEIAAAILSASLAEGSALQRFAAGALAGLRAAGRVDLWDRMITPIAQSKKAEVVAAVPLSLTYGSEVRNEDVSVLDDIVRCRGKFDFLADTQSVMFFEAVIRALLQHVRHDSHAMQQLVVEACQRFGKWDSLLIRELEAANYRGRFPAEEFDVQFVDYLKRMLVELTSLDFEAQNLLVRLGRTNYDLVLDIFWARIEREHDAKAHRGDMYERINYDAIPFEVNDELSELIGGNPDFSQRMRPWIARVAGEFLYRWNVSKFLQQMGGAFRELLKGLIESGNEEDLRNAAHLLDDMSGTVDLEMALAIVARTDDKEIWDRIRASFFATDVVSGEDGIARAHEQTAEELSQHQSSDSVRVRSFVASTVESLLASAKQERRRVEEDRRLREIELDK